MTYTDVDDLLMTSCEERSGVIKTFLKYVSSLRRKKKKKPLEDEKFEEQEEEDKVCRLVTFPVSLMYNISLYC